VYKWILRVPIYSNISPFGEIFGRNATRTFVLFFIFKKKNNQSDTYGCYTDPGGSFLGGLPWFDERLSNTQCSIKVHSNNWRLNTDGWIRTSTRWGRIG
jgi:hypothetical protein